MNRYLVSTLVILSAFLLFNFNGNEEVSLADHHLSKGINDDLTV